MKMDCGVSAGEAPNSVFPGKVLLKQISLPKTAWILIYQPWSCCTTFNKFAGISVSVNETLKSDTSNGTFKVSMRSSSEESLVIADDQLVENSLMLVFHSVLNFCGIDVSVGETLSSIILGLGLQAAYINKSYFHFVADNFYECQASLGSDSDDDFFSVKDALSCGRKDNSQKTHQSPKRIAKVEIKCSKGCDELSGILVQRREGRNKLS
ncbi:hypothetical protein D5086_028497 [Populus alba]|uniref:Uncharacterized protein n=1 Tax=Populus alba TaxID=43335 RepID=A0ACC4B066_POPAL